MSRENFFVRQSLKHQTPSLPDARPHSDRFRRGGRERKFLQFYSIPKSLDLDKFS